MSLLCRCLFCASVRPRQQIRRLLRSIKDYIMNSLFLTCAHPVQQCNLLPGPSADCGVH